MWRFILISFGFLGWAFYELSDGGDYQPSANSLQAQAKLAQTKLAQTKIAAKTTAKTTADTRRSAETVQIAKLETPATDGTDDTVADDKASVASAAIDTALILAIDPDKADTVAGDDMVARADTDLVTNASLSGLSTASVDRFRITLATTSTTDAQAGAPLLGLGDLGLSGLTGGAVVTPAVEAGAETAAQSDTEFSIKIAPADIRTVSGNRVNMRAGPGTDFAKVDQLARGTRVEVLETSGDGWLSLRVIDSGQTGWMADWLVTASN